MILALKDAARLYASHACPAGQILPNRWRKSAPFGPSRNASGGLK